MTDIVKSMTLGNAASGGLEATSGLLGAGGSADLSKILNLSETLASGAASMQGLKADQSAAKYNQQVASQNAQLAQIQTSAQLSQADRERRLRAGEARASAGASGTLSSGSILDIMQSSASQEALNLFTIKSEGDLKKQQYLTEAEIAGNQAKQAKSQMPYSILATAGKAAKVLTKPKGSF